MRKLERFDVISDQDCRKLLSEIDFDADVREPPNEHRKGQFRAGWKAATERAWKYSEHTLERLTWNNLGFRLGERFGQKSQDDIATIYEQFARLYDDAGAVADESSSGSTGKALHYDWETEVRNCVAKRRYASPTLADDYVEFFARAFAETRCPKNAWFGVHSATISLVVGGIYLASVVPSGDRGVWLLTDRFGPSIDGVDYRPVKATQPSESPLIWAHVLDVEHVSRLTLCTDLWLSYAQASQKILEYPIARGRDEKQRRVGKKKLLDFWIPQESRDFSFPEEVDDKKVYFEGAKRQITVNAYELKVKEQRSDSS